MSDAIDHRDLISLYDLGHIEQHSPGMIHWHPAGAQVVRRLEDWVLGLHAAAGYQEVRSPMLLSRQLWEKSGHWDKYQDLMFVAQSADDAQYAVKPMSCPGQIAIFDACRRSYRELPMRLFEFGHVHRREPSGSLSGWLRLRGFVQDDSHVFCSPDQLGEVIAGFAGMVAKAYPAFGFSEWSWRLSLRPDRRAGSDEVWDAAEDSLRQACQKLGIDPVEAPGEGAFYGPKLEAVLRDRLGREWQCGVAQVDFVLPERFELQYQDASGSQVRPIMVHHAVLGSLERWLAIALEHQGGLPAWLSPNFVALLPVGAAQEESCHELAASLVAQGIPARVLADDPLSGRVRAASAAKYAAIGVVGEREALSGQVSVRRAKGSEILSVEAWVAELRALRALPAL